MNADFKVPVVEPILASSCVGISELKKNPAAVIEAAKTGQVAVLNRNKPVAYVISPEVWDHILETYNDIKLAEIVRERLEETDEVVMVSIDDL